MSKLKKLLLLPLFLLTSCGNNDIGWGQLRFNYVYVESGLSGTAYYHIRRWKEYSPEGGEICKPYVGLEFTTVSGSDYYFYEQGLQYIFTTNYDSRFGSTIE